MKRISYLVIVVGVLLLSVVYSQQRQNPTQNVEDGIYYFEAAVPIDWSIEQSQDSSKILRVKTLSPDKTEAVYFYAFAAKGNIDIEKLADFDRKLGWELGAQIKQENIGFLTTSVVERVYDRSTNGLYAIAFFTSDGRYGYVILGLSTQTNLSFARTAFENFSIDVPLFVTIMNSLKNSWEEFSILAWIGGIIGLFILIAILYLLGKTGAMFRRGVDTKKALKMSAEQAISERLVLTKRWYEYKRKSNVWIFFPIVGWMIGYIVVFSILPLRMSLASLLLLVSPVLGYFGIFFVPSDELDDYFPGS